MARTPKNASAKKDFVSEWSGQHCGISEQTLAVAKTQAEWENLWKKTFSDRRPAPAAPKLPKGKMAIGIFTGNSSQPSEIGISGVAQKDGKTVVTWSAQGRISMLTVMSDPFLIKFVDKTDTPVVFERKLGSVPRFTPPTPGFGI